MWSARVLIGTSFLATMAVVVVVEGVTDAGDEAALVEFFSLWDDAFDKSDWESGVDPCGPPSWQGVTCSGDRVIEVDVTFNNIAGVMNESFCDLTELQTLNLTGNRLESIPDCLGTSPQDSLTRIGLARNDLLFKPFPDFTDCAGLVAVDLGNNGLLGPLPTGYGSLSSLLDFRLNDNVINGALIDFAPASPLETLMADSAGLSGSIPSTLVTNTPSLSTLTLHGNKLTGAIPAGIISQTTWTRLTLYSNSFDCPLPNVTHILDDGRNDCICGPGTWAEDASQICQNCPAGTYSTMDLLSGSTCTSCPQGTYNPFEGSDDRACLPCPPGTGSTTLAASGENQCVTCLAGTWGPGASACIACAAGTTSVDGQDSPCTDCPVDTYAPENDGVCLECPGASSGSTTCDPGLSFFTALLGVGAGLGASAVFILVVKLARNSEAVKAFLSPA